jgi:type IV pilus assembly protein PilB
MSDVQSIEDLILASEGDAGEGTAQSMFKDKEEELRKKDIERETKAFAASLGLPYIHLVGFSISPDAIKLIPEETALELDAVCFYYDGANIRVGAIRLSDELDAVAEELKEKYFADVKIYVISRTSFDYAIKIYRALPKIREFVKGVKITEKDLKKYTGSFSNFDSIRAEIGKASISDVVSMIIASAIQMNASDIHIEAEEDGVKFRFRIDGVLHEAAVMEKAKWPKVVSRIKLLAKVKINISDKPQDGRFTIFAFQENLDVRCSFLPTAFGESVVMRILRSSTVGLEFEDLGLAPYAYNILESEIKKPNGLILTTGPTGSGKTTTLYAVLKKLNKPGTKIVTMEDPIEYQISGVSQSQVDTGKGYTFAKGLRSILRQDPDILMVGEIRDLETAEISIQASLTGHLVLSTLHTNDASGVIPRLLDMGVKPFFLVPSINAIIGQRLVRKLCPHCKIEHALSEDEAGLVHKILAVISPKSGLEVPTELPKLFKEGGGCGHCNGLGYSGRVGIYEIFTMTEDIKKLTSENAPSFKILEQAIEGGMITMLQDGVMKCLQGVTSLEEVYRVIGKFDYVDALYDIVLSTMLNRGIKIPESVLISAEAVASDLKKGESLIKKAPLSDVLNMVMASAVKTKAGDVHFEPAEEAVNIRLRIDGILHDLASLPQDHYPNVLSQIKMASGFPTNLKKGNWDGRFSVAMGKDKIDCRISIITGGYGETVVIRLLNQQATALDVDKLGFKPYAMEKIKRAMGKTKGMIITTGPTGSGKTTTLYSMLHTINKPDVKIITVEDPIEYRMEGIIQTQVNPDDGYTFAAALRSLLRQNPNVIMIGEIRDQETAKIGVESALTGHVVYSTVHANTAAGAIARLGGLGIDRQLLASSIECSIGQRLARTICPHCREENEPSAEHKSRAIEIIEKLRGRPGIELPDVLKFYRGKGCAKCGNLGYGHRIGLFEVINISPDLAKIIQRPDATDYDIEEAAVRAGTVLLLEDGVLKALSGETTLEEVFRVAG